VGQNRYRRREDQCAADSEHLRRSAFGLLTVSDGWAGRPRMAVRLKIAAKYIVCSVTPTTLDGPYARDAAVPEREAYARRSPDSSLLRFQGPGGLYGATRPGQLHAQACVARRIAGTFGCRAATPGG